MRQCRMIFVCLFMVKFFSSFYCAIWTEPMFICRRWGEKDCRILLFVPASPPHTFFLICVGKLARQHWMICLERWECYLSKYFLWSGNAQVKWVSRECVYMNSSGVTWSWHKSSCKDIRNCMELLKLFWCDALPWAWKILTPLQRKD